MKLNFVKLNPTRNMTILVTTPVERSRHVSVAAQLMSPGSICAEQVGFLEAPSLEGARVRLQMMGGEFCGNASMSAGAFLAFQENLPDGAEAIYPLEVSGAEGIVSCRIRREGSSFRGTVAMPLPDAIREITFPGGLRCPVVFLPGIAHAIVPAVSMSRAEAEACIAEWCRISDQEAFGIILTDGNSIEPLVYVRETGTSVWEQGCGSGSAALCACLSFTEKRSITMEISQPGGIIRVETIFDGGIRKIEITGCVKIAAMGQAWID